MLDNRAIKNYFSTIICSMFCLTILVLIYSGVIKNTDQVIYSSLLGVAIVVIWSFLSIFKTFGTVANYEEALNQVTCETEVEVRPDVMAEIENITKGDEDEINQILCRPHFRKMLSTWDSVNTIATYHAIDSLKVLENDWLDKDFLGPILNEIFANKKIELFINDRFSQTHNCWYAGYDENQPSIVATFATIKILRNYFLSIGKELSFNNYSKMLGEDRIKNFFDDFLLKCFDRETGGIKDPDEDEATVASTGLAIRIFHLLYENEITDRTFLKNIIEDHFKCTKEITPINFIKKCFKSSDGEGGKCAGFSDTLNGKRILTCSTYYLNLAPKRSIFK